MPTRMQEQPITGNVLHQWTVQEYEQHERTTFWFILMITLGIVLVIFSLFTQNFLFTLIIILFAIILFLQSHQAPPQLPFQITETGIVISDRFYSYSELTGFFTIYQPPEVKTLYIDTKSPVKPLLRIPLLDQNPVEIRHTLQEFLVEDLEKEDEPLSDRVARNWGIH